MVPSAGLTIATIKERPHTKKRLMFNHFFKNIFLHFKNLNPVTKFASKEEVNKRRVKKPHAISAKSRIRKKRRAAIVVKRACFVEGVSTSFCLFEENSENRELKLICETAESVCSVRLST